MEYFKDKDKMAKTTSGGGWLIRVLYGMKADAVELELGV